ncbi:MAG: hypothetical protein EP147_01010 [Subdoligranulum sp.]|nr:hypothetical protein [Subdoligranulum sp.]
MALAKWGALMGGAVALAGVIMFTTSALHFVTVTDTHGGNTRILTVNQTEAAVLAQADAGKTTASAPRRHRTAS